MLRTRTLVLFTDGTDCDPNAPPTFDLKAAIPADDGGGSAPGAPGVSVKASVKATGTVK